MSDDNPGRSTGGIERLLSTIDGGSLPTRREVLRRSAAIGGGALALSVAGSNAALAHDAGDDDVEDVDVLNYALTLEHLEHAFYRDGLDRFSQRDFRCSKTLNGFGNRVVEDVHPYLLDIRNHEATHAETLTSVVQDLGGEPVEEACYDFGYEDVDEFLGIAAVLENTGVSAYDGAIDLIESAELLTAGATIATVEARHASYLNLLTDRKPFPAAFDEPKSMDEVLEAAGGFIVECE
jgi:rubrerythrin